MPTEYPSLTTDQIAAFVELARQGNLRTAAAQLWISEQGLRSRLLTLERRLGVELYRKSRGVRRASPLTERGQEFLPKAIAFLEQSRDLCESFAGGPKQREVHVAGSEYLIRYLLIDVVRKFHAAQPQIHIRLSARAERDVEAALLTDADVTLGLAAPYEPPTELRYDHLFALDWSLVTPLRHPLLNRPRITLAEIAEFPLVLFERGSSGRQHVVEAFHAASLTPSVEMEATTTQIIVRMVEAGLGVSIVPLMPNGKVTRGVRVGARGLGKLIRPIHSGILSRKGDAWTPASRQFVDFVRSEVAAMKKP